MSEESHRNQIIQGDALTVLKSFPDESVQMVITSPPYWNLRDYKVAGQIGFEKTPEEYVAKMVEVFREVHRVLRDDGTLWLNMGDSYAGSGVHSANHANPGLSKAGRRGADVPTPVPPGLKPKDLVGMPWRLALALQAPWRQCLTCGTEAHDTDWGKVRKSGITYFVCPECVAVRLHKISQPGWYLRSDIIWSKPNPMPESATDRPTKSHEYIFLLSKSQKYFYDEDAVREKTGNESFLEQYLKADGHKSPSGNLEKGVNAGFGSKKSCLTHPSGRSARTVWTIATQPLNSVVSYGTCRIASPDCPVHDYPSLLLLFPECGGLQAASLIVRNLGIDTNPSQVREGDFVSIPLNLSEFPFGDSSATLHNIENRRTVNELGRDVIYFYRFPSDKEYISLLRRCVSKFCRIHENKNEADALLSEMGIDLSGQKIVHIVGTLTFESPPKGCLCYHMGRVKNSQDHFASFPEKLANRCIKAGTSAKGCCPRCGVGWKRDVEDYFIWKPGCSCDLDPVPCLVLDPFIGSGTVALVCKELNRDYLGIDLSLEYTKMSVKRAKRKPRYKKLTVR